MARQKGLLKLRGTIGDVNFFVVKGVGYARMAGGGFNGDAIRTQPNMVRVRENASEFGHCSTTKKYFMRALLPLFSPPKSSVLHRRVMGLFTQLKDLDSVSSRGMRRVGQGILTAKGKRLVRDFAFVPEHQALDFVTSGSTFDLNTQTLSFTSIDLRSLGFPKGVSHLAVTMGVLDFDFDELSYVLNTSSTRFLEKGVLENPFVLSPELIRAPVNTGMLVVGVRFCEVIGEEVFMLKGLNAMGCQLSILS